jgi:hypothetical protein
MAESFVSSSWKDYLSRMGLSDAEKVLAQLLGAVEHFDYSHPHLGLKLRLPREYRRQLEEQRQGWPTDQTLTCAYPMSGATGARRGLGRSSSG